MKQKVLFAVNYRHFEEKLEEKLKNNYEFVGSASYREVVVDKVRQTNPDIVLIREALPGTKSILDVIYTIRNTHKNVRIIFMTGRREQGDLLLADLVSYGVYDIITSESIKMNDVMRLIQEGQSFDDVSYLMPKRNRDENNPQKAFDVQTRVVEKEVIKIVEKEVEAATPPVPQSAPIMEQEILTELPVEEEQIEDSVPEETDSDDVEPVSQAVEMPPLPPVPPMTERPPLDGDLLPPKAVKKGSFFKGKGTQVKQQSGRKQTSKAVVQPPMKEALALPPIQQPVTNGKGNIQTKQIIAFVGAVNGVGNTQISFNSAVKLAQDGYKVLYMELNPNFSTVDTSFQLGDYQRGLEKALHALSQQNQRDIEKSIIKMADVQKNTKNTNAMSKNYKRMPSTLDFLMFSQDYQTLVFKPTVDYTPLKDLCMLLLLQENYDYVVIDCEPFGKRPETMQDIASIASKIFLTLNQETAQIGHATRHVVELNKRINSDDKLYYVLNREVASQCDQTMIEEWLDAQMTAIVPDANSDFVDASFLGIPFVMHSGHEKAQQAFHAIKHTIQHPS